MKRTLMFLALMTGLLITSGCEDDRDDHRHNDYDNDYGRYVTVRINNFTSHEIDVMLGNAVVESLESGESYNYSTRLFDGETVLITYRIKSPYEWYLLPDQNNWQQSIFDNRLGDYHVNVYNDWVDRSDTGRQSTGRK